MSTTVEHVVPELPARLDAATAHLDPPFGVVDLDAFDRNAATMMRRAGGTPIRVATKSVRSRVLIDRVLALPGFHGALAFTLPEGLWLAETVEDVLVAYPSVDRAALRRLAGDDLLASRVTVMVDSVEHLDLIAAVTGPSGPQIRVALDLDASLRLLGDRVHLGLRRSPLHDVSDVRRLAQTVVDHPRFDLVGLMAYEGQVAGLADDLPGQWLRTRGIRVMQRMSMRDVIERRGAAVAAVREIASLEFVNGGGTGSLEITAADPSVTELGAGSGLYGPTLFDHYQHFRPEPAAYFALSVVRRPSPDHATLMGGGWVASGPAGPDRLPLPVWPEGLTLLDDEGAGEVQTPVTGPGVDGLAVGDRVWFRHAKAGEVCEHVDSLHLVSGTDVVAEAATYRGEGRTFL